MIQTLQQKSDVMSERNSRVVKRISNERGNYDNLTRNSKNLMITDGNSQLSNELYTPSIKLNDYSNLNHGLSNIHIHNTPRHSSSREENNTTLFPNISNNNPVKSNLKTEKNHSILLPQSVSNNSASLSLQSQSQSYIQFSSRNNSNVSSPNVGLMNLGNTCFMNSALQCLLHIEPLVSYFRKGTYKYDLNSSSPFKGILAITFAELLDEIYSYSEGTTVISPTNFKKTVSKLAPHLLDYEQQDCQEFLRFLLDGLAEDLKRVQIQNQNDSNIITNITNLTNQSNTTNTTNQNDNSNDNTQNINNNHNTNNNSHETKLNIISFVDKEILYHPTPPIQFSNSKRSSRTVERFKHISTISSQTEDSNVHNTNIDSNSNKISINSSSNQENNTQEEPIQTSQNSINVQTVKEMSHEDMATIRTLKTKARIRRQNLNQPQKQTENQSQNQVNSEHIHRNLQNQSGSEESCNQVNQVNHSNINNDSNSQKAWINYLNKNDSIINDIFGGQLQSVIECTVCGNKSYCFDPFLDLSVPLGFETVKCTVEDCLKSFSALEILDGDNAYNCETCQKKQKCEKRLTISKCPKILVIHIKRFRYTTYRREKLLTDVSFPIIDFDLSPYISSECLQNNNNNHNNNNNNNNNQSYLYDLIAVTNHSGSLNGGHYLAHVDTQYSTTSINETNQNWLCFNDSRVSVASSTTIGGPSAYILFYKFKNFI